VGGKEKGKEEVERGESIEIAGVKKKEGDKVRLVTFLVFEESGGERKKGGEEAGQTRYL